MRKRQTKRAKKSFFPQKKRIFIRKKAKSKKSLHARKKVFIPFPPPQRGVCLLFHAFFPYLSHFQADNGLDFAYLFKHQLYICSIRRVNLTFFHVLTSWFITDYKNIKKSSSLHFQEQRPTLSRNNGVLLPYTFKKKTYIYYFM